MNNCQECVKVASSYDADDVAAAWNSCVRLSCLRHGATVHTQFDLVPPYPKFEPKISLKRGGCIVVNTGNFLHAITVKTERLGVSQEKESRTQEPFLRGINPLSPPCNPISVNVGIAEFSLVADGSPGGFSPVSFPQNSDSENTDVESEASFPSRSSRKLRSKRPLFFENSSQKQESSRGGESPRRHLEKMNRIQEFTSKLSPTKNLAGRFKEKKEEKEINERDGFEFMIPSTPGSSDKKRKLADEAYDLTDENFLVDVPEKLSTFRRKRLAEKKYEFTEDEEDQNPYPITRLRYKKMAEAGKVFSQVLQNSSTQDLMVCVSQRNPGETQTPEYEDGDWTDMLDGSAYYLSVVSIYLYI
ncbi:uncharacterized protein LOC111705029 [Eurytemora carolleeae]|uniref:uncharacterized protein LOC111705029 n=1 Tax=Eurytemora carolleeae TaxID=1294199 RepID=UPI000C77381F|nr:uncharacterized protein LOC111705029 [Eurytemora carolleeae]|eukprot:XP_023333226.1 uncharacterized protein LOC111705029 [Eurytemora affinis]